MPSSSMQENPQDVCNGAFQWQAYLARVVSVGYCISDSQTGDQSMLLNIADFCHRQVAAFKCAVTKRQHELAFYASVCNCIYWLTENLVFHKAVIIG